MTCAHPNRCGSDGETCGHPDCVFCPNLRPMYLTSRTRRCSMCDRLAMFLSRLCRDHWLEVRR